MAKKTIQDIKDMKKFYRSQIRELEKRINVLENENARLKNLLSVEEKPKRVKKEKPPAQVPETPREKILKLRPQVSKNKFEESIEALPD